MNKSQQSNVNSIENNEDDDQNPEEGTFFKLLWYSIIFKTFSYLKGIYRITNWIILRVIVILIEFIFTFLFRRVTGLEFNITAIVVVSTLKDIIGSAVIASLASKIYKNIGFCTCYLLAEFVQIPVTVLTWIFLIFGSFAVTNKETIQYKIEYSLSLSECETEWTIFEIFRYALRFFCLTFYLRRNLKAIWKP